MIKPYSRIDYYSCVLYDVSLASIFRKFNIPFLEGSDLPFVVDDTVQVSIRQVVYRLGYFRCIVNLIDHRLTANQLKASYEFMHPSEKSSLFETVYPSIKIEAAGQELNSLRMAGYNVEEMFMDRLFWVGVSHEFKVTRCDFAFDFIDHPFQPDFPSELARYLSKMQIDDKLRLCTANKKQSGLVYKIERNPKGCCCYLGSQTSTEFVRVYDKLQEQAEKKFGTYDTSSWPAEAEFRNCKSWTRIELQTRREKSVKYLFSEGSYRDKMFSILKYIFDNFMVTDSDHVPEPFISSYFDLSQIQKIDFVQFEELEKYKVLNRPSVQLENWLIKNSKFLIAYIELYGIKKLVDSLNEILLVMYEHKDEVLFKSKLLKLNIYRSELLLDLGLSFDDLIGSYVNLCGFRYLKDGDFFELPR